jgi:hypothetical protein
MLPRHEAFRRLCRARDLLREFREHVCRGLLDGFEHMRAVDNHAALCSERAHEAPQHQCRAHVETGIRLVENENVRIVQQRGGNENLLAHPFRISRHRRMNVIPQVEYRQKPVDAITQAFLLEPAEIANQR